jgi:hypothetical protein
MPSNLLLLPLLGGYWFLHAFYYTRFRSQRLDGYRLLMESALVGVFLSILGRLAVLLLLCFPSAMKAWMTVAPASVPFLGTALGSLLLGLCTPHLLNLFLDKTRIMTKLDAQTEAIEHHGNHLLRLLHTASSEEKPIAIVLDNLKVYIGTVAAAPNLEPHDTYLAITPFYSGYRDRETLELVLTVDYLSVYENKQLNADDFRVVVPVTAIKMASLFDQAAYPAFLVEAHQASRDAATEKGTAEN